MKTVYIYALCDPESHEVRYVGKTQDLDNRLKNHRNDKHETRKARWLRSLKHRGLEPEVLILATVDEEEWQEAERYWITHFRTLGIDLTNHTEGGEGLHSPSEDTRAKISAVRKAAFDNPLYRDWFRQWVRSSERRAKISAALRGRSKSPDHIAKLPQNQPGRKLTEEHRKRISAGLRGNQLAKGYHHTEATRKLLSTKLRGNSHTRGRQMPEEEKRQRSEALKGRPKSAEHREKLRQAALRRWEHYRNSKERGMADELSNTLHQEENTTE